MTAEEPAASNSDAESILRALIHQQFNRANKAEMQRDDALAEVEKLSTLADLYLAKSNAAHAAGYAEGVAAVKAAVESELNLWTAGVVEVQAVLGIIAAVEGAP